jgi:predicted XRE-type DNA-binding protein
MKSSGSEKHKLSHVTKGDIFDDLGLSHAEAVEAKVKADLWRDLLAHITPLALTQKELARRLGVHQPEVSHLLTGKLSKFSAGTLIQYAVKLDFHVRVKLTPPKTQKGVVKPVAAQGKNRRTQQRPSLAVAYRA